MKKEEKENTIKFNLLSFSGKIYFILYKTLSFIYLPILKAGNFLADKINKDYFEEKR